MVVNTRTQVIAAAVFLLASICCRAAPAAEPGSGEALYTANCAACHGASGDGNGALAEYCYPRPRNFTTGAYKFRSTPSGSVPTEQDLVRTVEAGIPGTAMPGWKSLLTTEQRQAVVRHLMSLSPRFEKEKPAPIAIGEPPPSDSAAVAKGKALYAKMGCASCHGGEGRGDGPASANLKDESGIPIRPFDFTRAGRMRGGDSPADIYRTFTTGIDTTPMPAFENSLSADERWQLAHFIRSLGTGRPVDPTPGPIEARRLRDGEPPSDPFSAAWQQAKASVVELRPLWSRDDYTDRLKVRALYSNAAVAMLLEWNDATANSRVDGPERFRDGAAAQFPADAGGPLPFFAMGQQGASIDLWHWRADRQADVAAGGQQPEHRAGAYADTYHGLDKSRVFQTALAAGNPLHPGERKSPADCLAAAGPGTVTARPESEQVVDASGVLRDGSWHVVLRRQTTAGDHGCVDFKGLESVPVAFAVWDGAFRDRNGQKSISVWETLRFADGPPAAAATK